MSARASILPVFVPHLGCPHQCVFCNQSRITGWMERIDAHTVHDMLASVSAAEGKRELAFYGGSFTAIPEGLQLELLSAAQEGIRNGKISSIRLSTRPDAIDAAVLDRLKRFGVETVEIGAQSLDDEVLRLSGRGHTAEDVRRAARLVKEAGFRLILQMMTGLPGDSEERSLATAREIMKLQPDGVRIYPTVVVRDTALYDMWKTGAYREHTVEDAVSVCARLLPLFEAAGIPVIRLGLNPTEELSGGAAAAGAYHPALGELVRSRILLDRARVLLRGAAPGSRVELRVRPRLLSQMLGQNRSNVSALIGEFRLAELRVRPDPSAAAEIEVFFVEKQ